MMASPRRMGPPATTRAFTPRRSASSWLNPSRISSMRLHGLQVPVTSNTDTCEWKVGVWLSFQYVGGLNGTAKCGSGLTSPPPHFLASDRWPPRQRADRLKVTAGGFLYLGGVRYRCGCFLTVGFALLSDVKLLALEVIGQDEGMRKGLAD